MVRIRGQKIRMKRQKKKYVIIGAGAVAVLAAVTLIDGRNQLFFR